MKRHDNEHETAKHMGARRIVGAFAACALAGALVAAPAIPAAPTGPAQALAAQTSENQGPAVKARTAIAQGTPLVSSVARVLSAQAEGDLDPQDAARTWVSFSDFSPAPGDDTNVHLSLASGPTTATWKAACLTSADDAPVATSDFSAEVEIMAGQASSPEEIATAQVSSDGTVTVTAGTVEGSVRVRVTAHPVDTEQYMPSTDSITVEVEGAPAAVPDLADAMLSVTSPVTYTGNPLTPEVDLTLQNGMQVDAADYELQFFSDEACENPVDPAAVRNAGTYYVKAVATSATVQGSTAAQPFVVQKRSASLQVVDTSGNLAQTAQVNIIDDAEGLLFSVSNASYWPSVAASSDDDAVATASFDRETGRLTVVPREVGQATVTLTAEGATNYEDATATIDVTVQSKTVEKPTFELPEGVASFSQLVYNGREQTGVAVRHASEEAAEGYEVSGTTGIDADDEYTAKATLKDGYIWADDTADDLEQKWSIRKATPRIAVDIPASHEASEGALTLDLDDDKLGVTVGLNCYLGEDAVADALTISMEAEPDDEVAYAELTSMDEGAAGQLTVTPRGRGTTSIVLQTAESRNYDTATLTIPVLVNRAVERVEPPKLTVADDLVYTGQPQTGVTMNPPSSDAFTLSGNVATNANPEGAAYQAVVRLKPGYLWEDGTTEDPAGDIVTEWRIDKAAPTLERQADSITFDLSAASAATVGITYNGDGTVTAASDNEEVATVVYVPGEGGGSVVVNPVGLGSATIVVSASEGANYYAETTYISVRVSDSVTRVAIPEIQVNTGLSYTGENQVGAYLRPEDVNDEAYELAGHEATEVGTYEATLELRPDYVWANGTTGQVSKTWSIAKAAGEIGAPATVTLNFFDDAEGVELPVAYEGDWTSYAVADVSSPAVEVTVNEYGQVFVNPKSLGTATFAIVATDGKNYADARALVEVRVTAKEVVRPVISVVTEALVYNGEEQVGATVSDGFEGSYEVSGLSGTAAGAYRAIVSLREGFAWEGGGTDDIQETWRIDKAEPSLSVAQELVSMNPVFDAENGSQVAVAYTGDGAVNAVSSNTSVVRATYVPADSSNPAAGGTVQLVPVGTGEATVAVGASEGSNYLAVAGEDRALVTVEVALTPVDDPQIAVRDDLVYNGNPQTGAEVVPARPECYELTGAVETDAGEYEAHVALKPGYAWASLAGTPGEADDLVAVWSIERAEATLAISGDGAVLNAIDDPEGRAFDVSYDGDAAPEAFQAVSGNEEAATATYAAGKLVVMPKHSGQATITLVAPVTRNYEAAEASITVNVTAKPVPRPDYVLADEDIVYDGSAHAGLVVEGGDPDSYTVEGDTATEAGTHEARIALKPGYEWEDGSYDDMVVEWAIQKSSALAVRADSVTAVYDGTFHQLQPYAYDTVTGQRVDAPILYRQPDGTYSETAPSALNATDGQPMVVMFKAGATDNYNESAGESQATIAVQPVSSTLADADTGIVAEGDAFAAYSRDGNMVVMRTVNLATSQDSEDARRFAELREAYYDADAMDDFAAYSVELDVVDVSSGRVVRELTEGFGDLQLTLPVDEAYDGRAVNVLELHGSPAQEIDLGSAQVSSGAVQVGVDKLSEFVITLDSQTKPAPTPSGGNGEANAGNDGGAGDNAKSGDNAKATTKGAGASVATGDSLLDPLAFALVAALAVAVGAVAWRKRGA